MNTVKHGDTHLITLTVKDSTGAPVNLTGSEIRVLALPINGGAATELTATLGAATGTVEHTLTGTLAVGSYRVVVQDTKAGIRTTSPSEGGTALIVEANLG